jgi:sugar phosphate isomerase/epimerase
MAALNSLLDPPESEEITKMSYPLDRRSLLKAGAVMGAGIGLAGVGGVAAAFEAPAGAPHAEKLGWRLGCQAWSFNRYTFFEAIDKTAGLGLHYIEAYPGQKVSPEIGGFNEGLSAADRKTIKQKLKDSGVTLVNFGVTGIDGRKTFDFAKDMGIETIVSEPAEKDLPKFDELCGEYAINIAIHDHPYPSHYWYPAFIVNATRGLSKRIGACCDTGHWPRSALYATECLRILQGRIVSFHFKDVNKVGHDAHDVPWGTGINHVKAMLAEIQRQGIKAVFSIEYEYNWEHSLPEIAKCVEYFDKVSAELAREMAK